MTMTNIETYTNKIATLNEKAKEANVRVIVTEANLTDLLVDEASEADLARVRADHQAAVIDRDALVRGIEETECHLSEAKIQADLDRVEDSVGKIAKLMKKRQKLLDEGEAALMEFFAKIDAADKVAQEIHSVGAGARDLGNALNARLSKLGGWVVTRFYERFRSPEMERAMSGAIANHHRAIEQHQGKSLADLDPDYAELYRQHHASKFEAANDRAA
jgi:hypothetical protein